MVTTSVSHYEIRSPQNSRVLWVFAALGTLGIFVFDLSIPLGVAGGVPYVGIVLIALWLPNTRPAYILAIICIGLTIGGFFFSPQGGELWKVIANRLLAILAIAVTAGLCVQHKRSEMLLRKSQEKLAEAQTMAHIGCIERDLQTSKLWWSNEVYRIIGVALQDYQPNLEGFLDCVHPEDLELVNQETSRSINSKEVIAVNFRIVRPDGEVRMIRSRLKTHADPRGNPIRLMVTVRDITAQSQAQEKLLKYQGQLKRLASQLTLAEEQERKRIATELHDRIGQNLVSSKFKLGLLQQTSTTGVGTTLFRELEELIGQIIQDTRSLIFEISPPVLHELGLEPALEWLTEQTSQRYGFACDFEDDQQPKPLEKDTRVILFQVVRELLTNVVKHAQSRQTKVNLWTTDEQIAIRVEDDGIGFDTSRLDSQASPKGGFGLFSISERVDLLGGKFNIESDPGRGTRVVIMAPLKREKGRDQSCEDSARGETT